jgi:hypothetical protein
MPSGIGPTKQLPAQPVAEPLRASVDAPIGVGRSGEQPASPQFRMRPSQDGVVKQPLEVGSKWTRGTTGSTWKARRSQISRSIAARCGPEPPLALSKASLAASRPRPRIDAEVLARERVPMLAMRLALVRQILCVGDELQVVGVPAGIDAATMMEFLALRDWAP